MDDFYGSDFPLKVLELKGLRIDPSHREHQADLMRKRWFDYRLMHPVLATYWFAHLYQEHTRLFYIECVDIRTAEDARGFSPDDIFMSRDMTSMWLARSAADELGLPYEFVLRFAKKRFLERAMRSFPRPNQLYGEEFELDVRDAWEEQLRRQLTFAKLPRFRASNFRGELDQAQHVNFIVAQIRSRPPSSWPGLLRRCINEDLLSLDMARSRFPNTEPTPEA